MKTHMTMFFMVQFWLWSFPWIASAAPLLFSGPLLLANESAHAAGPFPATIRAPLKALPDPWDYKIDGIPITIRFSDYGGDLDAQSGSALFQHIRLIAYDHKDVWDHIIEDDLLTDDYAGLELKFYPQAAITWGTWYEVTLAMESIFLLALSKEFMFHVQLEGQEQFSGHGLLRAQ